MSQYLREEVHSKTVEGGYVAESARRVELQQRVEVLVCGGGPAGVGAALAAAREGARVLLLERFGMLGGMWTAGLVNPLFCWQNKGYIVEELKKRLDESGAWGRWQFAHSFDGEVMRLTLEQMLQREGAEFQYFTQVTDAIVEKGRVVGVITESKEGRRAILADVVIDATGDGDVAARSGCRYELGRGGDGMVQPVTLMFEISGARDYSQNGASELYEALASVMTEQERRELMPFGKADNVPWIITTPGGLAAVQYTHIYRVNPLDSKDLTRGMSEGRGMIHRVLAKMQKLPQFKDVRITQSASALGVRESRRILGRNRVTFEDTQKGSLFADAVIVSDFGLDVHDPAPQSSVASNHGCARPFEIPYGCLLPEDAEGIIVAGRCISGDHLAHASYRVTGTVMCMGQAAGLAAAMAVKKKISPSDICGQEIKTGLQERGAKFLS